MRQPDITLARKLLGWEPKVGVSSEEARQEALIDVLQAKSPGVKREDPGHRRRGLHRLARRRRLSRGGPRGARRRQPLDRQAREPDPRGARFYELDIRAPRRAELIRSERPDVLNHHAAQMDVRRSRRRSGLRRRASTSSARSSLLEAARDGGVKQGPLRSSGGAVYGEQERFPAPETHPTDPVSPYGVSKRAGELYLAFYQRGARAAVRRVALRERLRPAAGPARRGRRRRDLQREAAPRRAAHASTATASRRATTSSSTTSSARTWPRSRATLRRPGEHRHRRRDRRHHAGREPVAISGKRSRQSTGRSKAGEQRRSVIDPALAGRELGWKPATQLDEGLKRTVRVVP